ncbi:hypothetical protein HUJ04_003650 [Dendroctonus ponderosae]|nr:hypothetical protein HUJ04_003650 [Dendroctonus ponderosae]
MLPNETDQEPKTMKANEGNLQLYARANAPSRDYYGLTITGSFINLNIWKVSYGPHTMPKQRHCSLEDFRDDKVSQDEIRRIFGEAVFDYVLGLAQNRRKLENLPPKLFLHILGFLRIEDILRLMCCSKIICELCNHEHVWKLMFMKKFGRQPSKEEKLLAIDSSWREVFKRRLLICTMDHPTKKDNTMMDCGRQLKKNPESTKKRVNSVQTTILSAISNKELNLFLCIVCGNILRQPVTVKCGHTLCMSCLDKMPEKCRKCSQDVEEEQFRVNVLVQGLIEKWTERNKLNNTDTPVVILVLHPRYVLRSGCAGFQYTVDISRKISTKWKKSQIFDLSHPKRQIYRKLSYRRKPTKHPAKTRKENQRNSDSFGKMLDNMLIELEMTVEKALRDSWECISEEDLECLLCRRCLADPVTTPCGHTFCRDCLTRVLDHRLTCPLCVSKLSVGDYFRGTTAVLDQATQFLFPKKRPHQQCGSDEHSSDNVSVFVCTNAFPGVACPLYVNEPRYRLLVRRCLESRSKTFAMTSLDPSGAKLMQYGTILEVKDAISLQDGRIILSTQGIRRFKVISRDEKDGYDTAKVEHIYDITPTPERISGLVSLHRKVYTRAVRWIHLLSPAALSEVERLIGKMPQIETDWLTLPDGPSWTWWLIPILPLSAQLQVGFLSSTSLEKRLRAIDKMLEHMKVRMQAEPRKDSVTYTANDDGMVFCSE